jgi:hypothetical protein
MTFSSSKDSMSNLVTLPVSRVREILAANRAGRKVEQLQGEEYVPEVEEPTYRTEEDSITRFDNKKRSKNRNKNRNKNRQSEAHGSAPKGEGGTPNTDTPTPQPKAENGGHNGGDKGNRNPEGRGHNGGDKGNNSEGRGDHRHRHGNRRRHGNRNGGNGSNNGGSNNKSEN